jgi:hypothetical protein
MTMNVMSAGLRRECPVGVEEGMLKSLLDGEVFGEQRDELRSHAASCASCSERLAQLRLDGALVQGRLQLLSGAPSVNAALAYDYPALPPRPAVSAMLARAKAAGGTLPESGWRERVTVFAERWSQPVFGPLRPLPLAAGTLAAGVLLSVSFTQPAVQSFAQGVVQSLRIQKVQPVKIDPAMFSGLPAGSKGDLDRLGTYRGPTEPRVRVASVADASKATGLTLRAPSTVPAALRNTQTVYLSEAETFSITYDGQKLTQAAQDFGVKDPALLMELRTLNGVTVKGSVPSAAAVVFGNAQSTNSGARPTSVAGAKAAASNAASHSDFVAFIQLKSPSLDVPPTVNVDKLRDLLLKSGSVPPALANQLLAIQDWRTTLPIPVTRGTTSQVQVDGTTGTLVTGEMPFPALIWQKDGAVYALTGTLSESDLLAAARSLQPVK